MLSDIAIIPALPLLVPELGGTAAAEVTDLRESVLTVAASLPPRRWIAIGAGISDATFDADSTGTFAGFGVDVPVRLSPQAAYAVDLPLPALIAGWVRGRVRPDARVPVQLCADPAAAVQRGRQLRIDIDRSPEPVGVLLVADGANTLTSSAPGGHRPDDVAVQRGLDDALVHGDTAALAELPAQIVGRSAFAALAGLVGAERWSAEQLYRGAPYGVGYFIGSWRR